MAVILIMIIIFWVMYFYVETRFSKLLRIEYETDRDAWLADGKPKSSSWWAPDEDSFQNAIAGQILSIKLCYKTPVWVKQNESARVYLRQVRITIAIWSILAFTLFLFYIFH